MVASKGLLFHAIRKDWNSDSIEHRAGHTTDDSELSPHLRVPAQWVLAPLWCAWWAIILGVSPHYFNNDFVTALCS